MLTSMHLAYLPGPDGNPAEDCIARFSFPSRLTDYFWHGLPVVGPLFGNSATAQVLAGKNLYLDLEDNALFNQGGPFDGKTQNFLTPAAFYVVRRKEWKPTHAVVVLGGGMQIATSSFHPYNHNLIPEVRILF